MRPRTHRAPWPAAVLAAVVALTGVLAPSASASHPVASSPTHDTDPGLYLVTLTGHGTASHPSTRPAPDRRFDRERAAVSELAKRLRQRQDAVLAAVGDPTVVARWTTALNGFAARLDTAQVKALRGDGRVALVERSTVTTPAAETAPTRLPSGPAVREQGSRQAGDGVVVGIVDSGIWPENPAFAALPQPSPGRSEALPGFAGDCAEAERWSRSDCNDKVVSARFFVAGFGEDRLASHELLSPRDVSGHGSHTASVVAGEPGVDVQIGEQSFGPTSGVAPGARIAVYKACWAAPDPADDGCATADTVTAVDRAVTDGVDVLTYAVHGSSDPRDTVSRAFLGATRAGVAVVAAAGNTGPGHATVGNTAPWVTTVGSATHRTYTGAVRLDDGTRLEGAMVADRGVAEARVVLARDVARPGAGTGAAARCESGSLDAGRVDRAIVVCERGEVPRVDKSATVAAAGGAGMILVNTSPDAVEADVHAVPTVHLDVAAAGSLRTYLRDRGERARASLEPGVLRAPAEPRLAPSSGRGPVPDAELLKPDVVAPGAAVLGAVSPASSSGPLWDLRSGSSVGAAHVAGLTAALAAAHPQWDPSALRSALMTTADPVPGSGGPLHSGAGHVDAEEVLAPALVLEARWSAYRAFLEGELRGRELNTAAVVVEDLVGRATVTRRLTNVGRSSGTWTAVVDGLDGYDVTVRPRTVTLAPGESRRVRLVLEATATSSVRQHESGAVTWAGPRRQVRLPVVVRAAAVDAPRVVDAELTAGNVSVRGRSGTGRSVTPEAAGLAGAHPVGLSLRPAPFSVAGDSFTSDVSVPTGAEVARFEVTSHNLADDLDLRVHRGDEVVAEATGPAASAVVTLLDPAPGEYRVEVRAARAGNGAVATGELTTWVVGSGGASTLDLEPGPAGTAAGGRFGYELRWPELDPTRRWLAVVRYAGTDDLTLVRLG